MKFLKLSFSLQWLLVVFASLGWAGGEFEKSFLDYFRVTQVQFGNQHILHRNEDIYDSEGHSGFIVKFIKKRDQQHGIKIFVVGVFNGIRKELPLEDIALPFFKQTRDNLYLYGDSRRWSHLGVFSNGDLLITSPSTNPFDRFTDLVRRVPMECVTATPHFGYEVSFEDQAGTLRVGHLVRVSGKDRIEVVVNGELYTVNPRYVKSVDGVRVGERIISNSRAGFFERTLLGFSFDKAEIGTLCAVFSGVEPLPLDHIAFTSGEKPVGVELGLRVALPEGGLGAIQGWYRDGNVLVVSLESGEYSKVFWNQRMVNPPVSQPLPSEDSSALKIPAELEASEPAALTEFTET
jgi:hypothetical protein